MVDWSAVWCQKKRTILDNWLILNDYDVSFEDTILLSEYEIDELNYAIKVLDFKKEKERARLKRLFAEVLLNVECVKHKDTLSKYNKWDRGLVEVINKPMIKEHETVFDKLQAKRRNKKRTVFDVLKGRKKYGI